jgi:hypothetical protein
MNNTANRKPEQPKSGGVPTWHKRVTWVQRFGSRAAVLYILGFVVFLVVGMCPLFGYPWILSEGLRAIVAGIFAFAPPLYFAIEYFYVRRLIKWNWVDPHDDEKKRVLDDVRTSQDTLAKVWLGLAAGIAFLYVGDYPRGTPVSQNQVIRVQELQMKTSEGLFLTIAATSLVVSVCSVLIARSSLSLARQIADREQR